MLLQLESRMLLREGCRRENTKLLRKVIFSLIHMMREGCRRENMKCMARAKIFFNTYTHYYT